MQFIRKLNFSELKSIEYIEGKDEVLIIYLGILSYFWIIQLFEFGSNLYYNVYT